MSPRLIEAAAKVKRDAVPEVLAVSRRLKVTTAVEIAKLPKQKQRELVAGNVPEHVKQELDEQKVAPMSLGPLDAIDSVASRLDRNDARQLRGHTRQMYIGELTGMLPVFEASWHRGRALRIAELALLRSGSYDLRELVFDAMKPQGDAHPLAAIAFGLGCHLHGESWSDAWLTVCELGDVPEAIALEVLGKPIEDFRRSRRRKSAAFTQKFTEMVNSMDRSDDWRSRRLADEVLRPEPSLVGVIEQMIDGELVVERQ
ncbi:MAG TPA: hypothetical protein VHZ95_22030 [Polyangiales bacterium]|nr:hypothetical protein [Polyangiales bacterium]